MKDIRSSGYIEALFVIIIWTGFILVSRLGGKSVLLAYDIVALRFGVAALCLLPVWFFKRRINLLNPKMIILALTGGVLYAIPAYLGFKYSSAAHAGVLLPGTLPFGAALFSWIILKEHPSRNRIIGLISIFLGVVCLAIDTLSLSANWYGDAAFVTASMFWAVCSVLVKKWKIDAWDVTVASAIITAAIYLPIYIFFLPKHIEAAPIGIILLQAFYQGILAVIVALVLYMRAVEKIGPSKMGILMVMVPVTSSLLAVPLLGEGLTVLIVLGLIFTCFGAWIGNRG